MSTDSILLRQVARRWRVASLLPYFWFALAISALVFAACQLLAWPSWPLFAVAGFSLVAALLDRHWRLPLKTLCAKLDANFPELQDSCALLLDPVNDRSYALVQLQRRRTAKALRALRDAGKLRGFRPTPLRSPLLAATGACIGLLLYVALQQFSGAGNAAVQSADGDDGSARVGGSGAIVAAVTDIEPPPYTGLAPNSQSLHVKAAELSQGTWHLTLDSAVFGVQMVAARKNYGFSPVDPLPSRRWNLTRTLRETDFYQLSLLAARGTGEDAENVVLPEIYNIEIVPDQPPEFSFDYPRDTVTVVNVAADKQSSPLNVSVRVSDDFGVQQTDLLLTLASGSGENVRFRNERIPLQVTSGEPASAHYRFSIPAQRYQIEPGDELYWYLESRDNRAPDANVQKSQHFIVRWPQQEIFGLSDTEGMAIKILPEYFRSQRQLIIDTEALLEDENNIGEDEFRKRSESLAYEQNLLRMRYGRFLGEEDSELEHGGESGAAEAHSEEHTEGGAERETEHRGHADHSGHDNDGATQQFGDSAGVVAAAGHQHDSSEHATLFDPETKELLRNALNAMWSSWRDLSIVEPRASLPDQHAALRYIKEVQQASRIYLQRVGFEAPALDESRRLSGEHEPADPPRVSGQRDESEQQQLLALLKNLRSGEPIAESAAADLQQLPALREEPSIRVELAKQLRRYRQQPGCANCRRELAALLYQLLPPPQPQPSLPRFTQEGASYRNWLQQQGGEGR